MYTFGTAIVFACVIFTCNATACNESQKIQNAYGEARQVATSQILVVNFKNILLAILLKLTITSGFLFHSDLFFKDFEGRVAKSSHKADLVTFDDLKWAGVFLLCSNVRRYDCLYRMACDNPREAQVYVTAGKVLVNVFKELDAVVPYYDSRYEVVLTEMEKAVKLSNDSVACVNYPCGLF